MIFKNFKLNSIVRIALLSGSIFGFFYSVINASVLSSVLIGCVIVLQVVALFNYIDSANRKLTNFLESIRFSEFTSSFSDEGKGPSFKKLYLAFNNIIKDFQDVRSEKEKHAQYLKSIVKNIDVSIIAYQGNGKIEITNEAAKKLFQTSNLKNIQDLAIIDPQLPKVLLNLKPGENSLIKFHYEDDILQLAVYTTQLKINNKKIILATIKNIQHVLEEKEAEAWQKLIRVLTHEIMNSITPIASLSDTVNNMLSEFTKVGEKKRITLDNDSIQEIQQALFTINKRSTGLMQFVESYRNLTRIPIPNFTILSVKKLFKNLELLMQKDARENNIEITYNNEPENLEISADEKLIEQVLINLIKNAIHSLQNCDNKKIKVNAFRNKRGGVSIQVIDNGEGILEDVIDKIFIPFFTTKQNGSGIGLSLSKQIMMLHGGSISAKSVPEKETCFTLTF